MPLPNELDNKIRHRFDELIQNGESLLAELDKNDPDFDSKYQEWIVKTSGLLQMLFGDTERGKKYQKNIESELPLGAEVSPLHDFLFAKSFRQNVGTLKGLRNNYVNGFFDSLEERIVANISSDYMGQAEALLGEGTEGQFDHVPAAVLCGAVLEDALRRLCQKQTPQIEIVKSNGDKKTFEPLIQDLQRAQVFNKLVADQLRSWAKIRTYAAHGEFNEFTREQVKLMLLGVRHFLVEHL